MKLSEGIRKLFRREKRPNLAIKDSGAAADDDEIDLFDPFPEPVTIEIRDVIDLHTMPPKDVKRVTEEYLEQARMAGFRSVRIIHGKGIGVQREIVRTVLARTPFIQDWTDAPPDAGGLGATLARLKLER